MADSSTYTEEFRVETADYIISTGRPTVHVAEELGLNPKTVGRWVKKRKGELAGNVPGKAESDEMKAARKRIRELEMENEFLKKASAFFARNQAQGTGAH